MKNNTIKFNELMDVGIDKIIKDQLISNNIILEDDDSICINYDQVNQRFVIEPVINFEFVISYSGKNVQFAKTNVKMSSSELRQVINDIKENSNNDTGSLDEKLTIYFTNFQKYGRVEDEEADKLSDMFSRKIENYYGIKLSKYDCVYYPTLEDLDKSFGLS
ncbi:hypothetical protein [Clostridium sp. C8-1-8]|uniref:hypothetical protein n=1 Tax=Clostridium sp. C8-1-8 TaxID=2698831 RepID=UPI00136E5E25|nr:hypothetical protein [Clostridium sp. C8-1-8]